MGVALDDSFLRSLSGTVLHSERRPGTSFRLEGLIGEGSLGAAFLALQQTADAIAPAVVKILRPSVGRGHESIAEVTTQKELAALERLSARIPPTPFVVTLLDSGSLALPNQGVSLPWLALEHVHGGLDGATLESRVERTVERTGAAFDPERAALALRCLGAGLEAIHQAGVVHRDVTPRNVLCCGFGETEVFKLSDFGLARVENVATFGEVMLGTPGYSAPEQSFPEDLGTGPYSDVFSLACVAFFLLTGEDYFPVRTLAQGLVAAQAPERRSVATGRLCPELAERRDLADAIDRALAQATRAAPRERTPSARALCRELLPLLAAASSPVASSRRFSLPVDRSLPRASSFRFRVLHPPDGTRTIRQVAWDSDGRCLAIGAQGLLFWDGSRWHPTAVAEGWVPRSLARVGPGRWLLLGDGGRFLEYGGETLDQRSFTGPNVAFTLGAGKLDDIAAAVAETTGGALELHAWVRGRFLEPCPLPEHASVTALAQLGESEFLVAGRLKSGAGSAHVFHALGRRLTALAVPETRAYLACATRLERGLALLAGSEGHVVSLAAGQLATARVPGHPDLSAAALDILGRKWLAASSTLFQEHTGSFRPVFSDDRFRVPFIGLLADVDRVVAVSSDGGVAEGLSEGR